MHDTNFMNLVVGLWKYTLKYSGVTRDHTDNFQMAEEKKFFVLYFQLFCKLENFFVCMYIYMCMCECKRVCV